MTSSNIWIFSILCHVLLVRIWLQTSEKDNYQAVMNTFRQKGKFALLKLIKPNIWVQCQL